MSERGRDGGSCPSKGVGRRRGAAWVASRLPGDGFTGGRNEGLRVPRVEAPQICYASRNGTAFRWEERPCTSEFFSGTAWEPGAPGSTLPLYGLQRCRVFLLAPFPGSQPLSGWGRGGLGSTQLAGLMPSAYSVPGVPWPLPPRLTVFLGKGLNWAPQLQPI